MSLVLDPKEFRLFEGLRLNPRKSFAGRVRGERLTRKKGISIEFADYREYTEGDDLRHLDWNVLARLDTPVMRTYQDEEDLAIYLLLDLSPSMEFGDPTKLSQAKRLACALGFTAMAGGDAVLPRAVGPREAPTRPLRGRASYPRLAQWVEDHAAGARDGLAKSLRGFAATPGRAGVAILLSDGLDPEVQGGLNALAGRGHEVWFLQILSDVEIDPDLEGDLRLTDNEGGEAVEITANSYALKEYRRRLQEHNDMIAATVRRVGGRHALVRSGDGLDAIAKNVFRREGWLA